jgi:hypothetical protein
MRVLALLLSAGIVLVGMALAAASGSPTPSLPRFTEEREAAALFFVKKHVPEIQALLEELKKSSPSRYQQEIREIFQVTEMLADLQDDPRRHDLELRIWKAETKAHVLVAKLATPKEDERKRIEGGLHELARELVELDTQVLELKTEQLDKELGEIKDELSKARDQMDRNVKARYEELLNQAKKRKKG